MLLVHRNFLLKIVQKYRQKSPKISTRLYSTRFRTVSASKKVTEERKLIRNVGIMAHIDAGKTTTTERMLFYSGVIEFPGEVHHGDTVTDFLPQERERGITIQSAVVSFQWDERSINLIDTPGHVDFTFEVERSLRAVDSAVAILDASAGVEAQTLTVWRQAMTNQLPRLIFLNKMDKATASHEMCLNSIEKRLHSVPLLLQLPVYDKSSTKSGSGIVGVIDLVRMQRLIFDSEAKGMDFKSHCLRSDKDSLKKRYDLIERVSDFDAELANRIIETESVESVSDDELEAAIKRITLKNDVVPVLLGSSFKYIGVQPLLDAILTYLPHPGEVKRKDPVVSSYGQELCSFVFKTLHDKHLGSLTFMRLFSGTLNASQKIYNVTREKQEKILKIYQPLADDLHEVQEVKAGHVAVVSGLRETFTGDTVTSTASSASSARKKLAKIKDGEDIKATLTSVDIPEPVFFCAIEPASLGQQKALDEALLILQREDPSLHVRVDPDTAQTVLSGMGELHLEIIHERLKREFKVDADMGTIQIAYKETIMEPIKKKINFERKLADQKHSVVIELSVIPKEKPSQKIKRGAGKATQENLAHLRDRQERCIQNGVDSSLRYGPKLSFPIIDVEVVLHWFETTRQTSETIIEAAAASCIRQALKEAVVVLLEPMVNLEISLDGKYQNKIMDDLNRRRFQLESIDQKNDQKIIMGLAPLGELMGYSTALRTLSSGMGTFSMQFSHYQKVLSSFEEDKIVAQVRGFS